MKQKAHKIFSFKDLLTFMLFSLCVCSIHAEDSIQNKSNFLNDIESYGRIGYLIGGNAPIPMPSTIRSINKFGLQPNISLGVDVYKPINKSWGVIVGIHFENKGMHTDANVKNYNMEMTKESQTISGVFTGKVDTHVKQWMFTMPIQVTYGIKRNVKVKFGPYVSYLTQRIFDGFAYDGYLRSGDPTGPKVLLGDDPETRGSYDFSEHLCKFQTGLDLGLDWFITQRFGIYADLSWGVSGSFKQNFKTIEQTLYPIYGTVGITYKIR